MNKTKIKDLSMGEKNEIKFRKYLQESENIKIKKFRDKYSELDFRCNKRLMELKSRNNRMNRYADTMCGMNKIIKARNKIKRGYSVEVYFLFTDGLYKWDFVDNAFDVRMGGRNDRGEYEYKEYAYIPINDLKFITNKINSLNF
jgi:hypothetical protein